MNCKFFKKSKSFFFFEKNNKSILKNYSYLTIRERLKMATVNRLFKILLERKINLDVIQF